MVIRHMIKIKQTVKHSEGAVFLRSMCSNGGTAKNNS
jgi:hypothetical protein